MLKNINSLLAPLDKLIEQYKSFIGYIFIALSFLALPLIFFPTYVKDTGEQAQNILLFILFLPIFSRVFGIKLAQTIMPLRKEIGIFMGTLAFVHGGAYILEYPSFILEQSFWWQNGSITYFFAGFVALIFSIPLTLTSNKWAMRKLGKKWKLIHRGVYIIAIFTVLHVVLINWVNKGEIEYGQFAILSLYFIGKIAEWRGVRFGEKKEYKKGQKWVCVPCGFIYDPAVGDKDSNIAPGTEFTDIPDDWTCPDCGVSKSDFIPYEEGHEPHSYDAKVVGHTIMNPTTLELSIEVTEEWTAIPGQFMRFYWHDERGTFSRMYSVAEQIGKRFTFTIKLAEGGRGGKILRELHIGDTIDVGGVHGNFTLVESNSPKVFIATGTGLAPIYHMLLRTPSTVERFLYFSVATEQELFYVEKLRAIENLNLHIHVTREDIEGFEKGRVDITSIDASPETEWYLCGNPKMVADAREILQERGFEKVYFEEFN